MSEKIEQAKTELEKYNEIMREVWDEEITDFDELRFMKFFKAGVSLYKPAENCKYDSLLKSGNAAQLEKLQENEHKSGFDDIDVGFAFWKISDNLNKAHIPMCKYGISKRFENDDSAIAGGGKVENPGSCIDKEIVAEIRARAANIANFAHMVILKCDKELERCSE